MLRWKIPQKTFLLLKNAQEYCQNSNLYDGTGSTDVGERTVNNGMKYAALIRLSKKEQNLLAEKEFLFLSFAQCLPPLETKRRRVRRGVVQIWGDYFEK